MRPGTWVVLLLIFLFTFQGVMADSKVIPATGTKLSKNSFSSGDAYLTVKNTLSEHAVFIITQAGSKSPLTSYFIRKGDSYNIRGIPEGSYNFYYELGLDWNSKYKQFNDGKTAMFADASGRNPKLVWYDSMTAGYEITLYGVRNGNANTESLDRDSFPKIT